MKRPFMVLMVIASIAIYVPQVCALESEFIRDNLARTYEGTFQWRGPGLTEVFLLIWLIFIPVISLIALSLVLPLPDSKKQSVTVPNLLALCVLYNFAAVVILLQHAITMPVIGTYPIAFAITERFFAYVIAVIAGTNSVIIGKKLWRDYIL